MLRANVSPSDFSYHAFKFHFSLLCLGSEAEWDCRQDSVVQIGSAWWEVGMDAAQVSRGQPSKGVWDCPCGAKERCVL